MLRRIVTGFVFVAAAAPPALLTYADESAHVFEITITKGKVPPAQRVLKVTHQDEVSIAWSVDRPMTIHLEGYDIVVEAYPGRPETMKFRAFATGRFPVHVHEIGQGDAKKHAYGHGAPLRLEVHPR
jgi:hypothetical protein